MTFSARAADCAVFGLGFALALVGDASHVSSGTTRYTWPNVPVIGESALWFPFVVAAATLLTARLGARFGLPGRERSRWQVVAASAAVLALYVATGYLRGLSAPQSVALVAGCAVAIGLCWDRSRAAFLIALAFAVLGPLAEIGMVHLGAVTWASDSNALFGVAPWLPCLYFAASVVASGCHRALARERPSARERSSSQRGSPAGRAR